MAVNGYLSTILLAVQGLLLVGTGIFTLLDPDGFVAGTGDIIAGQPTQLLHSIRYISGATREIELAN